MLKEIIWSPLSEQDFSNILEYLKLNWGNPVVDKYINRIDTLLNQISLNPKQYPLINKRKKVRRCVVTKHNSLYYRINKDSIDLLRIYGNFQNPQNLKLK